MKQLFAILTVLLLILAWLVIGGSLSREAVGLVLGVAVGALLTAPVMLVYRTPTSEIVYRDRIIYRVAEVETPEVQP